MSSIIEGYNYDIFISYRQKDNKYDGWVTGFVENLKKELEATFKEEISVYFDINPHDGLLETHDVDASLKEKLKCLIFIPIISRTYCDPKSFAWEHEFRAFIEEASRDQFGLKVKLNAGNVSNRVLPVQIHDLDQEDKKLVENLLGGFIRGIEFIYKEPGVNKPLTSDDDERKNLNNTKYRIQINKVANAIRDILSSLKSINGEKPVKEPSKKLLTHETESDGKKELIAARLSGKTWLIRIMVLVLILALTGIFIIPVIFKKDVLVNLRSPDGRISVAVFPFENLTNSDTIDIYGEGVKASIINTLSDYANDLKVIQADVATREPGAKEPGNTAGFNQTSAKRISQQLDASLFIYGSIAKRGSIMRLNAQVIDSKTGETYKPFMVEGGSDRLQFLIDSISSMIRGFLVISNMQKDVYADLRPLINTKSPEAYFYFVNGENARRRQDDPTAVKYYSLAVRKDSDFTYAMMALSTAYSNQGLVDSAKKWCLRSYKQVDQSPILLQLRIKRLYAIYFETPYEEIKYLRQYQEYDNQSPNNYYQLGWTYTKLLQYDKAIPELEKALELYNNLRIKPYRSVNYSLLGESYHKTGQYSKEKKLYMKALRDFPDNVSILERQAILALSTGKMNDGNVLIVKCKSIFKERAIPESLTLNFVAGIYSEAGIPDKAEEYYRQALKLDPENATIINNLAYLLYRNNIKLDEGISLIDKALQINPDHFFFLATKGELLYRQGKYREALEFLEKSWKLKPAYFHEIYLDLEAAKKAVAGQAL